MRYGGLTKSVAIWRVGDVAAEVSLMYCHMVIVPNGDVVPYGELIKSVAIWRVLNMLRSQHVE